MSSPFANPWKSGVVILKIYLQNFLFWKKIIFEIWACNFVPQTLKITQKPSRGEQNRCTFCVKHSRSKQKILEIDFCYKNLGFQPNVRSMLQDGARAVKVGPDGSWSSCFGQKRRSDIVRIVFMIMWQNMWYLLGFQWLGVRDNMDHDRYCQNDFQTKIFIFSKNIRNAY